jgi:hypothetical protein
LQKARLLQLQQGDVERRFERGASRHTDAVFLDKDGRSRSLRVAVFQLRVAVNQVVEDEGVAAMRKRSRSKFIKKVKVSKVIDKI